MEDIGTKNHELLNKDPEIVPDEYSLIVLDSKSAMYMAKNGKDTKHTRHIARIMHFVRIGEKCKMHKIDWCASCMFLHSLKNALSLQCVWYVWYPYHS